MAARPRQPVGNRRQKSKLTTAQVNVIKQRMVARAEWRIQQNVDHPDTNYIKNYSATSVTFAFLWFTDVKPEDEFTRWERFNMHFGGPVAHAECWFTEGADERIACSSVSSRGVFFIPRDFNNPKKPYTFYDLYLSEMEYDKLLVFFYKQDGKPFNNEGMLRSWLYLSWCRQTDETQWFCSELLFAGLSDVGIFERIQSQDPEFNAFVKLNPGAVSPTFLHHYLVESGMLQQTNHRVNGVHGYRTPSTAAFPPPPPPIIRNVPSTTTGRMSPAPTVATLTTTTTTIATQFQPNNQRRQPARADMLKGLRTGKRGF